VALWRLETLESSGLHMSVCDILETNYPTKVLQPPLNWKSDSIPVVDCIRKT
jgi:hypothetical protein